MDSSLKMLKISTVSVSQITLEIGVRPVELDTLDNLTLKMAPVNLVSAMATLT